ncbi:hypothetical protein [Burkholderia oklahomensis]|uniref:hypothetical protein n=1 Tax=Burkholderia oklahomensis TaxID=342113 RepID=UPI0002EDB317|nr:hypothetical protein [Burkholderia oklahomensis]QPS39958.1 hypothetical protein I6G57_29650 [Burkholderia oklahomensis]
MPPFTTGPKRKASAAIWERYGCGDAPAVLLRRPLVYSKPVMTNVGYIEIVDVVV